MSKSYIFPDPLDARCELQPDSMATPLIGVPDLHPSNGAACQSFDLPMGLPNKNGATLIISRRGYASYVLHGILDVTTPTGFTCDVFRLQKLSGLPRLVVSGKVLVQDA